MENRLILGIDNSLDELVLVLSIDEKIIEERHIKSKRNTSEIIGGLVKDMLGFHDYSVGDLNLIIVTLGPGTFTGIRVGLSFCKGLVCGKDIRIAGVPTLDVLGAYFSSFEGYYLFPVIDAKKGEVFYSVYYAQNGEILRKIDYASKKPEEAIKDILKPCICFGSGVELCIPYLLREKDIILIREGFKKISGEQLLKVGLKKASREEEQNLVPVYGRKSDAEIKFKGL
ncbi:MAG: tRNA (adenosine(37)-N6)-threonylcarbamoyltransferase complex dimerization subunit type 1 TsaB [Syntrophorhabdaceae bacterium]|nr:tRNA (adenosine(37)-N6)-threonylcarbamoyltransferase complex dimerization subunit type 1 TsaB [Syntrophorhabdaceae bacterium]